MPGGPPPRPGSAYGGSNSGGPRSGPNTPRPQFQGMTPLGYDPAKPQGQRESKITNTRMEIPAKAWAIDQGVDLVSSLHCFAFWLHVA